MQNLLIAEAQEFSSEGLTALRQAFHVRTGDLERRDLIAAVGDVDVLWVRLRNRIDREVMDAAPRLKTIVTNTTGLDHIDLDEAERRHIDVVSLRGETAFLTTVRATAELTMGLMLALVRHVPRASAHVRKGGAWDRYPFKGHDLYGKTVGIVGYGRLGRIVGGLCSAFGMRVIAATRNAAASEPDPDVVMVPLDELLPRSDIVTLHVNLADDTRMMFGAREFGRMPHGSWFVNTARGELVDEEAMVRALEAGHLAGAAVDVIAGSYGPALAESPVLKYAAEHDNLIVTPHIGGYTFESLARTEVFLAEKLLRMITQPQESNKPQSSQRHRADDSTAAACNAGRVFG